jgi:iron complex outermembrane receptor protein
MSLQLETLLRKVCLAANLLLLGAAPLAAQSGTVEGRVRSAEGAPVSGAEIITLTRGGATAISGVDGTFRLTLAPGRHTLVSHRIGYRAARAEVEVQPGGTARVELVVQTEVLVLPALPVLALQSRVAGKTDALVLETPQAISMVGADVIEAQGARDLGDVVRNVPGIILSDAGAGPSRFYSLRGFYSDSDGNFRKNGAQELKSAELLQSNVERVEVLKGPSSVLYGHLDPGGVVNIVTKKPLPVRRAQLDVRTGSFGFLDGNIDVTGPIGSGQLAYRLNAAGTRGGNFVSQVDYDKLFVAPALRWTPGGRARFDLELEASRSKGVTNPGLKAPDGTFDGIDRLDADLFLGEEGARFERDQLAAQLQAEINISTTLQARSTLSYTDYDWRQDEVILLDFATDGRTLGRRLSRTDLGQQNAHGDLFLIGSLRTGRVEHQTTLGGDLQTSSNSRDAGRATLASVNVFAPQQTGVPSTFTPSTSSTTDTDVSGLYLNHRVAIGRLRLTAGVRRTEFTQKSQADEELSASDWTVSAGGLIDMGRDRSLYVSYGESFAPTLFTLDGRLFDPSFGRQWEVGAKAALANGRLLATASVFDLENTGVLSFYLNDQGEFEVEQGGRHGSRGIELEASGRPAESVFVIGSYTHLSAQVREDPAYDEGTPLGGSPKHTASLWAQVQVLARLGVGAGVFHVGERKAYLSSQLFTPGHTLFDASITADVLPQVRVTLLGRNLFDGRHYIAGDGAYGRAGSTRSLQLRLSAVVD